MVILMKVVGIDMIKLFGPFIFQNSIVFFFPAIFLDFDISKNNKTCVMFVTSMGGLSGGPSIAGLRSKNIRAASTAAQIVERRGSMLCPACIYRLVLPQKGRNQAISAQWVQPNPTWVCLCTTKTRRLFQSVLSSHWGSYVQTSPGGAHGPYIGPR